MNNPSEALRQTQKVRMTFLETARLLFRSHQKDDEEHFVQMQTDPEVRRYVGGRAWLVEEAVHRFRGGYLGNPSDTYGLWATILKAESRYIGYCGLRAESHDGARETVHMAYYLARPYWGRGLATEACRALLDVAFVKLGLAELHANVQRGHAASEYILQKLGFELRDRVQLPGRILHFYQLSREDWMMRKSGASVGVFQRVRHDEIPRDAASE